MTENKGDLISREALKEKIENLIGYSLSYEAILNAIDNAPTVETERPHVIAQINPVIEARPQGEWITIHKQNSFGQDCICFECDKCHKYKVPIYKLMITEPLEVCPNCGAKMKGGAE